MGVKQLVKEIDGFQFTVSQLDGVKGLELFYNAGALFGPAFGSVLKGIVAATGGNGLANADITQLGGAFEDVVAKLFVLGKWPEYKAWSFALLDSCVVEGEGIIGPLKDKFPIVMAGRPDVFGKLVWATAELNWGNSIAASIEKLKQALTSAKPKAATKLNTKTDMESQIQ